MYSLSFRGKSLQGLYQALCNVALAASDPAMWDKEYGGCN
jgi:hypothetical protein